MSNRKERRATEAKVKKLPGVPNLSGTDVACGNCRFALDPKIVKAVALVLAARALAAGQPAPQAPPDDEVYCCHEPTERVKKVFGWCGKHEAKA